MPATQVAYDENIGVGYPGQIIDTIPPCKIRTYVVDETDGIGFGLVCGRAAAVTSGRQKTSLGSPVTSDDHDSGKALAAFGISIRDITRGDDNVKDGGNIGILESGDIMVMAGGAVSPTSIVTFNTTTGVLSAIAVSTTSGSEQFALIGAKWLGTVTATAGGLVILSLGTQLVASTTQAL